MADDPKDQLDNPADLAVDGSAEASTARSGPRRLPKKRTKTGCLSMLRNAGDRVPPLTKPYSLSKAPNQVRRREANMHQLREIQANLRGICPTGRVQEPHRHIWIIQYWPRPGSADRATTYEGADPQRLWRSTPSPTSGSRCSASNASPETC